MRLSFDNSVLFTVSTDGNLIIYDVKDRDTKGPAIKRIDDFTGITTFSEEILTEKSEMQELRSAKEGLENDINNANEGSNGVDNKMTNN